MEDFNEYCFTNSSEILDPVSSDKSVPYDFPDIVISRKSFPAPSSRSNHSSCVFSASNVERSREHLKLNHLENCHHLYIVNWWRPFTFLVEIFHVISECKTAVYFSWSLTQVLAQPVQLFNRWSLHSIASCDSWTDSDLQLFIETEQDQTKLSFIQYVLWNST